MTANTPSCITMVTMSLSPMKIMIQTLFTSDCKFNRLVFLCYSIYHPGCLCSQAARHCLLFITQLSDIIKFPVYPSSHLSQGVQPCKNTPISHNRKLTLLNQAELLHSSWLLNTKLTYCLVQDEQLQIHVIQNIPLEIFCNGSYASTRSRQEQVFLNDI